ncbi:hypothetical protein ACJIZ3_020505 [Penstemon smallii]|uniref:Uncharacterized protein n=1 Tax=Penstemon smallii TaxID=265156 RepID=A0ABD3SJB1_9LAMI
MEEDGNGDDLTPFWLQSTSNLRHPERLRRRVSSLLFSSGVVVLLLLVTAVFLLVFVLPSTPSFSPQIFKPNSVRKSWDSLNVVLVLVAVVFGFFSRIKNENEDRYSEEFQASPNKQNEAQKSNPSTPNQWYNYSTIEEQKPHLSTSNQWYEYSEYQTSKLEHKNSILKRNSTSYPDLREFSSNRWDYGDYQRLYSPVDAGRVSDPGQLHRRHRSLEEVDNLRTIPQTKTVFVDTLVKQFKEDTKTTPPLSQPPAPPAPPAAPPPKYEEKLKTRAYDNVPRRRERSSRKLKKDLEPRNPISAPKPPTPPSAEPHAAVESLEFQQNPDRPHENDRSSWNMNRDVELRNPITTPPPPPLLQPKSSKSDRKRSGATGSATKDFLNSLYHKKKKMPRQKSVDNLDSLLHQVQDPLTVHLPPPSSPPQTPSAFQNLFSSKKHKRKRTIKVSVTPPEPPPPPPRPAAREPKSTSQTAPKTMKTNSFDKFEENSNSGGESPFNRIPPPPPPPPPAFFKNPAWKFVVQGDYVRINSSNSSRSESPDLDDVESDVTPSAADVGGATPFQPSPLYCPSPDVNTKAESFINNFRAKLKLEKIHSMSKREPGLSTLGPKQI